MRQFASGILALDTADVLQIAEVVLGEPAVLRDRGLLLSTLGRPFLTAFGDDAYPALTAKCAALLHGMARNHAFLDGNKRTAWVCTVVFARMNDLDVVGPTQADVVELVLRAAQDQLDVSGIADVLARWSRPAP